MFFAQEYLRSRQKGFAQGMATTTQIADANLLVAKSQIEQALAQYEYLKSFARLLMYVGAAQDFMRYQSSADVLILD